MSDKDVQWLDEMVEIERENSELKEHIRNLKSQFSFGLPSEEICKYVEGIINDVIAEYEIET